MKIKQRSVRRVRQKPVRSKSTIKLGGITIKRSVIESEYVHKEFEAVGPSKRSELQKEALKQRRRLERSFKRLEKEGAYQFDKEKVERALTAATGVRFSESGRIEFSVDLSSYRASKAKTIKAKDLKKLATNYEEAMKEEKARRSEAQKEAWKKRKEVEEKVKDMDAKIKDLNERFGDINQYASNPDETLDVAPDVFNLKHMVVLPGGEFEIPEEIQIYKKNFEKIYKKYAAQTLEQSDYVALDKLISDAGEAQAIWEHLNKDKRTDAFGYYQMGLEWLSKASEEYGLVAVMKAVAKAYHNGAWRDFKVFYWVNTAQDLIRDLNRGLMEIAPELSLEKIDPKIKKILDQHYGKDQFQQEFKDIDVSTYVWHNKVY